MPSITDPGEKSLSALLSTVVTKLDPTTYVFATLPAGVDLPPFSEVCMFFRECEGVTVITSLDFAKESGFNYFFPCKMVTLDVTSSLEAVGFIAAIATELAKHNMGVNPVSAFFHDHLFLPLGREAEAIEIITCLAKRKAANV